MLRELRIANFAIIDEMALTFAPGMNVLTGETGAGKSIVTRAIGLLCGDRASADLIRTDCEEAEIEGVFDVAPADRAVLSGCGLPEADEIVVRRLVSRSGKGRVHINGSLATASLLAQLGRRLIHVYGQHEHALLLKADSHLTFIDEFGGHAERCGRMASAYDVYRRAADRFAELTADKDNARKRLELLRFQVGELKNARLEKGEEEDLRRQRELQRHAEKINLICREGEAALYSGDDAIATGLTRVATRLQEARRVDESFGTNVDTLAQCIAQVEEVAFDLRRAAERIQFDTARLEEIEERLAALTALRRKYDCDTDALVDKLAALEAELEAVENVGTDLTKARQDLRQRSAQAWEVARELSRARHAAAAELERRMASELGTLGLQDAVFKAVFAVSAADGPQSGSLDNAGAGLTAAGGDVVEFYLSANPGEAPKALSRIASGGELSRIMLALKALTAGSGEVATLIFDEVDVGIGGAVAEAVGKRLHSLGTSCQVLCITHLPQIAALADHHFAVEKHVANGRTRTSARVLPPDERVRELARMLGATGTPESRQYARRLMRAAEKSPPR